MSRNWILFLFFLVMACSGKTPVDLIIRGGKIYTSDENNPTVEAVAVKGDTIVYAGTVAGLEKFNGEKTKIIDLKGGTLMPGFIESHGHLMGLGFSELNLDLSSVKSYA